MSAVSLNPDAPHSPPPLFDQAAMIRRLTVAALIAYGTPAGSFVEEFRTEEIGAGDMPRLVVATEEDYEGVGLDPPCFKATCTLVVSAYAERAQRRDVVADLDAMIAQIREALFANPVWVKSVTRIASVKVVRHWQNKAERIVGEAHTAITVNWTESYPPLVLDDLLKIDSKVNGAAGTEVEFVTTLPSAGD